MHIGVSTEFFNMIWNEFDHNKNGELDYSEFKALMNKLLFKNELIPYFKVLKLKKSCTKFFFLEYRTKTIFNFSFKKKTFEKKLKNK